MTGRGSHSQPRDPGIRHQGSGGHRYVRCSRRIRPAQTEGVASAQAERRPRSGVFDDVRPRSPHRAPGVPRSPYPRPVKAAVARPARAGVQGAAAHWPPEAPTRLDIGSSSASVVVVLVGGRPPAATAHAYRSSRPEPEQGRMGTESFSYGARPETEGGDSDPRRRPWGACVQEPEGTHGTKCQVKRDNQVWTTVRWAVEAPCGPGVGAGEWHLGGGWSTPQATVRERQRRSSRGGTGAQPRRRHRTTGMCRAGVPLYNRPGPFGVAGACAC